MPQLLADLERTRYFYDRIVSVQRVGRVARMYDLEVEGVHDFVANGFICHNSQGAEFPAVVIPLLTSHAAMLGRTLLYTAVTRARRLVVIVGQHKALRLAVNDWRREPRHTALGGLLDGSLRFAWRTARAAEAAADQAEDAWEGLLSSDPEGSG